MAPPSIEKLDINDRDTAQQVLAVQRVAYRVEADLIGFDGIPQLAESLAELRVGQLDRMGVRDERRRVVAALAFTDEDGVIDIDRLVVSPGSFRSGYARALMSALRPDRTIVVGTGLDNRPAHALHESLGFVKTRDEEVVPGLMITRFRREASG